MEGERRCAEICSEKDAFGRSDALLRAIVASAMDAIVALDSDQRVVLFNPATEAMFESSAADALGQPLRNLYENAIKYSSGGMVLTTASSDGATVTIDVADQGVGIAPEHVGAVFERFRRVGADPTVRGMGLGLYLSRLLVEAQNGRIAARSPGVGQGATFSITLPIAEGWTAVTNGEPT